ncbi:MAG TPA: hypothetical protein VIE64_04745 [Solirubrobacterales bacterium]|jgi:hypothetical protein
MDVLLTIAVTAVALFVWICLFKVIPSALLSMFRYRLWRQRDDLAAEIRRGTFEHRGAAEGVLERIECFIRLAPELSPLHIWLMRGSALGVDLPEPPQLDFDGLSPKERDLLAKHLEKLSDALTGHALFETPSGWITVLLGLPIGLAVIATRRALNRDHYEGNLAEGARRRVSEGSFELAARGRRSHDLMNQYV